MSELSAAETRLRIVEAVLKQVDPSWSVSVPGRAVDKVLEVARPLVAWIEAGDHLDVDRG